MSIEAMRSAWRHSQSKGTARLVLLALADEANSQGLVSAYRRSQSWLASKANVDGSSVRRAIRSLVDLGELEVLALGDGRKSSDYRLALPDLDPIEGVQDATPPLAPRAPRAGTVHAQGVQDATPIIPFSPGDPPSDPATSRDARLTDSGFDAFWTAYPRADGKPAAVRAWFRAVKVAPPERIMEGLDAWLAYWQDRNEPEFVPWAQKWLNQQQWFATPPARQRPAAAKPLASRESWGEKSGVVEL